MNTDFYEFKIRHPSLNGRRHHRPGIKANRHFTPETGSANSVAQDVRYELSLGQPLVRIASLETLAEDWDDEVEYVEVVLESSLHRRASWEAPKAFFRTGVDLLVLRSILYDYEAALLADGCACLSVLNTAHTREIRLDEHKLLFFFGTQPFPFAHLLLQHGIPHQSNLAILPDAEHVHLSNDRLEETFHRLVEAIPPC